MRKKYVKRTTRTIQCEYCGKLIRTGEETRRFCNRKCYGKYISEHPELTKRWTRSKGIRSDTLCWDCEKAVGGSDCPWANKLKPVEGWDAISTILNSGNKKTRSYQVLNCPLFKRG